MINWFVSFLFFFCVCRSMKINILSVICLVHTKFKESSGDLILIIVKPISNLLKMHYLLCMSFMLGNFGTNSCEKNAPKCFIWIGANDNYRNVHERKSRIIQRDLIRILIWLQNNKHTQWWQSVNSFWLGCCCGGVILLPSLSMCSGVWFDEA